MNSERINTYQFRITNPIISVSMPNKLMNIQNIKIVSIRGTTAEASGNILLLSINEVNNKYSLPYTLYYTKSIPIPSTTATTYAYQNLENNFDVVLKTPMNINMLNMEITVNGVYNSTQVSNSSPVFVELEFT